MVYDLSHTLQKKLRITKLVYDFYLFFRFERLEIVEMQTNDILILANNNCASTKEEVIKSAKIMTKYRKYLILAYSLKFNSAEIKHDLNSIVLTKKSHVREILLVIDHGTDSTSYKRITRKKLSLKKQYLA